MSISVLVPSRDFHISPRRKLRANMGREMKPVTIWKRLCYNLFITYLTMTETKELSMNNNRLLYSAMYNMERYCTSLYCIENTYWTSKTGFQYNTDEYSIFPYCT